VNVCVWLNDIIPLSMHEMATIINTHLVALGIVFPLAQYRVIIIIIS